MSKNDQNRKRVLQRVTRMLDIPMAILSLLFFILVIVDLVLPEGAYYRYLLDDALLVIWILFGLEFVTRLAIAPDRRRFLQSNWLDIVVLIIPVLRIFRFVLILRGLSMFRLLLGVRRGAKGLWSFLKISRFLYVIGFTILVTLASAAAILHLEKDAPNHQIKTFGDALWWSGGMVTTVSSDLFPVTPAGRGLAVLMMVYGMTVFGYFVGQAASYLQSEKREGKTRGKSN